MAPELLPWLAALVIIIGLLALFLDIFLATGFTGVAGIIFLAWGVVLYNTNTAITIKSLVIGLVISIVAFIILFKLLTNMNFWKHFTLGKRQQSNEGYNSANIELVTYMDKEGIALTPLRPSGAADIDGERVDVVSEGDFILKGQKIKVVYIEGVRVVVRAIE